MSTKGGTRAVIAALLANSGIAVAKFLGFLFTRSSTMLAESIHSVADAGNQGLLLLGSKRAQRPPSPTHQFGYGRARYFWAFIVAMVLFLLGGLFSLYEGIEKLRHPHELESPGWAIGILAVAIVLEGLSFRTAIHESDQLRGKAGWVQFIRKTKNPELPVVLLEDLGAMVGLVLALIAVVLATVTGNSTWDGVGTVAIGSLLVVIAIVLATEMKSLLLGESASEEDQAAIRQAIESAPEVRRLIFMQTQHIGPEELLVAVKVEFDSSLTVPTLADAVNAVEALVREAVPTARRLFIEPDLHREMVDAR